MFHRFVTPSLVAGIAAIAGYHGFQFYTSIALPSNISIATADSIPHRFAQSFAVSTVNPHHHPTIDDSRSVVITVGKQVSHEQILARFLTGFFGGYVFAPERIALQLFGKTIVDFGGKQSRQPCSILSSDRIAALKNIKASQNIWRASELDRARLPAVHTVLFGAFRIVDVSQSTESQTRSSHVDIAFGADDGFIAGIHRFSVLETEIPVNPNGERVVTIVFDHTSHNPRENKPLGPDFLQTLHMWYAMLLFKEGIVNVLKAG